MRREKVKKLYVLDKVVADRIEEFADQFGIPKSHLVNALLNHALKDESVFKKAMNEWIDELTK